MFSRLLSEPACSPQSIYIEPALTSCEEYNAFADLYFKDLFIMPVMRFLSTSMFFYIGTAQNSRAECNEFADLLF